MQTFRAKEAVLVVVLKAKAVCNGFKSQLNVLDISFTRNFTFNKRSFSRHYYQRYCGYSLKLGCMDEKQAIFKQLTLKNVNM